MGPRAGAPAAPDRPASAAGPSLQSVSWPSVAPVSLAVDAGTTGVRALVVDEQARVVDVAYRELTQHFPRPGWVEHDADEIWQAVRTTLGEVGGRLATPRVGPAGVGITNQRETVVAWDRHTGSPLHRAIVWQDRRTAARCRRAGRRRPPAPGPRAHRAGPRPLLLGHQDGVAARTRAG